jgi:spore coat protein U-like protein
MKAFFYLLIVLSGANFAHADTALNLSLAGDVVANCSFSVNSVAAASQSSPSSTSVNLTLGAVQESPGNGAAVITCNDYFGYTLTASSLNNGLLKSGIASISYQLDFDSQIPITLTTTAATVLTKSILTTPETAQSHPIRITYPGGNPNPLSGTYSDTVTLTLTGN